MGGPKGNRRRPLHRLGWARRLRSGLKQEVSLTMSNELSSEGALPLDWLVTPAVAFNHPDDVLSHPGLTVAEKRAILASWASDAHAVDDMPWLRQLECGARIQLREVLSALRLLDKEEKGVSSRAAETKPSIPATRPSRDAPRVTHSAR
jgi:hypothetical protein